MKIIEKCSMCGTECESAHDFDSLEAFHAAAANGEIGLDEFEHDAANADCGGTLTFSEAE
jgi:hypothetical protein